MVTALARWLKKAPQPHSIRYTTPEDEERILEVTQGRARWKDAAEALEAVKAQRIECLDAEGNVLRVMGAGAGEDGDGPGDGKSFTSKEYAAMALILDAQGKRINEAHERGADAASRGQDNLVQVVNILTAQWSATMNALQGVSMNLAKLARQQGLDPDEDDGMSQQMQQLLGIAAMKLIGGDSAAAPANPNGKKEK